MKDPKNKRRFTQFLSRTIMRTRWVCTRLLERNWIFMKNPLSFRISSKWARHPLFKLSPTRLRRRGWSFFFKSQRMNVSIRMRRSSQEILLRPRSGVRSRLPPHLIFPLRSFCFLFFNKIKYLLKYVLVNSVLPEYCEVDDPRLQDAFLAKLGFYTNLPPLR
jgi:hypothetical protein